MKATVTLLFTLALTAALAITLTMKGSYVNEESNLIHAPPSSAVQLPRKRISRFLAANDPKPRNPNAADHCQKDKKVCLVVMPLVGRNATCCNNKCKDLYYDDQNCGSCKKKCLPFQTCCRGECVNLAYDKRHCGACNNMCHPGPRSPAMCDYGFCDYA